MKRRSRLYTSLRGLLNQLGQPRQRRSRGQRTPRCFESLEMRLALAGINGPFTTDPAYNPQEPFHIHAGLTMYVNSQKVTVPVFTPNPEDIHTHDTSGSIHIHPQAARTTFVTLNDVFEAWRTAPSGGNPNAVVSATKLLNNVVDTGHSLRMFVNGVETDAFEKYQIHDKDQILLVYGSNPVVTLNTNQGPIVVEMLENMTPGTVDNFLTYVNSGAYDSSVFHRYVSGFVLQGGGFKSTDPTFTAASQITNIPTNAAIVNEFDNWAVTSGTGAAVTQGNAVIQLPSTADLSRVVVGDRIRLTGRTDGLASSNMFDITAINDATNTVTVAQAPTAATNSSVAWTVFPRVNIANTIAMAKLGGDPNSATNQFFINLANNDSNLDLQNGGFTVFARIFDVAQAQTTDSTTPANQLLNGSYTSFVSNLSNTNAGGAFTDLPLATGSQLVTLQSVTGDGEVKGTIYNDTDGSGTRGSGEVVRSGITIYDDANNNQQKDATEESTTTDSSGNYTLRLAPGQHFIRMVPVNSTTQSNPQAGYTLTVQVGRDITARDFGLVTLAAPTGIDLVAATDSGSSSTDNITSFNNSTSQKAPQFTVSGVLAGATVQILSDGVAIGQATVPAGGNGTITVTANGTTTISEGTHTITAAQTLNGSTGTMVAASGLTFKVDTTGPQFTSTAPLTANIDVAINYDAQTNEESSGVIYTLQSPPTGATIGATTGVISWTPTTAQLGSAQFTVIATDAAGNASNQVVSLNVTKLPQVRVRLAVTDLTGNPLTAINVGDVFQLRGFVKDVRTAATGASAIYEDVTWNGSVASVVAGSLVYGTNYSQNQSGTISAGLLDEIGASSPSATALGNGEFQLFQVNLRADAAGSLAFVGNPPDVTPAHNVTLFNGTAAVPTDEIDFGQTTAIQVRQVSPGSLAGFVYTDTNNNGTMDSGESPIPNVTVTLTGTDSFGVAVSRTATTGTDGSYKFDNLNPGSYKLNETQPTGQLNSLPIVDGKDTIGSQGGTASANDELTITLAEGTNGTNNNFAELVGYTLGGTVAVNESPGSGSETSVGSPLSFANVQIQLYSADAQDQPVGSALQTTEVNSDGSFSFAGLSTGKYVANVATPVFLTGTPVNQVIQVGTNTTPTQVMVTASRQAQFISYRDYMNSSSTHGVFAALADGATKNAWTAFDSTWDGFTNLSVTLVNDGNRLRIDAKNSTGAAVSSEVPVTDPRVRVVGQDGTTKLFRLTGSAVDYNLNSGVPSTSASLRLSDSSDAASDPNSDTANDSQNSGITENPPAEGEASGWLTVPSDSVLQPIAAIGISQDPLATTDSTLNAANVVFVDPRVPSSGLVSTSSTPLINDPAWSPSAVDQALAESADKEFKATDFAGDEFEDTVDELAHIHADSADTSNELLDFLLDDALVSS